MSHDTESPDLPPLDACPKCGAVSAETDDEGAVFDRLTKRGSWQAECQSCGLSGPRDKDRVEARKSWNDLSVSTTDH